MKVKLLAMYLIFGLAITSCGSATTKSPNIFESPTEPVLTPAKLNPIIGTSEPTITISNNWLSYQDGELGLSLKYPPDWQAIGLNNAIGVGLYPPNSDPSMPSPSIKIKWRNTPYTANQPINNRESLVYPIEVSGITGQEYQDSKYATPAQSHYIELPYRDGTLFFITTIGPSVNLVPQLYEILKTLNLSSSANFPPATDVPIEPPANQVSLLSFIYPVDGQILDYEGSYLFKIKPIDGADGYLWGFFQNDVMVWENMRDEGELSGTEYGIPEGSIAHNKFIPGPVQVWVRASISGQWTDPTIITIYLKP
jgi:hypothetical protein